MQQRELLPPIVRDRAAWDSRRIREALSPAMIPFDWKIFDAALYPADKIFTDLFANKWFTDREIFPNLQREAAEARCAELAEIWAWAALEDGGRLFNSWDYDRDVEPTDGGGAVVHLRDDLQVVTYTALRRRSSARPAGRRRIETPGTSRDDLAAPITNTAVPPATCAPIAPVLAVWGSALDPAAAAALAGVALSRAHVVWAKQEKSRRLQWAIAGNPDVAEALKIIGLLGMHSSPGMPSEVRLSPCDRGVHNDWFDHPEVDELIDKGLPCPVAAATPAAMFGDLLQMPAARRRSLAAALVAECFASWPGDDPELGDSELVIAVARELDLDIVPLNWTLTADYLERCSKPRLVAIAVATGIDECLADKTKAEIIDTILLTPGRDLTWYPAELRFASSAEIAATLAAEAAACRGHYARHGELGEMADVGVMGQG